MKSKVIKLSLIVPTMDRYEILKNLPILLKQGLYEIILVDSSNALDAAKNKRLREKLGIKYYILLLLVIMKKSEILELIKPMDIHF